MANVQFLNVYDPLTKSASLRTAILCSKCHSTVRLVAGVDIKVEEVEDFVCPDCREKMN